MTRREISFSSGVMAHEKAKKMAFFRTTSWATARLPFSRQGLAINGGNILHPGRKQSKSDLKVRSRRFQDHSNAAEFPPQAKLGTYMRRIRSQFGAHPKPQLVLHCCSELTQ